MNTDVIAAVYAMLTVAVVSGVALGYNYYKERMERECNRGERVNHPDHYNSHPSGVECIDIVRHHCFDIGNAIKYLWRAGLKKDASQSDREKEIEDLKKAIWYIQDRIDTLVNQR